MLKTWLTQKVGITYPIYCHKGERFLGFLEKGGH
jgi:hypothetical protein